MSKEFYMPAAQDRTDIIEAVTRLFWYVDVCDWNALPTVFADPVVLDYTKIWGGEPMVRTPEQVGEEWSKLLGAFDATQHLLGNHLVRVDGDRATLTAVFQAIHLMANLLGSPRWTLGGTYHIGLARTANDWLVDTVVMTPTWADGNKDILTQAAQSW
jgi:hypothetical protein